MTIFQFYEILFNNIILYLFSLILSSLVYYKIFITTSSSWFNPLRFNVLTSLIGFSVIIFLFFTNNVTNKTFLYLLCSIFLFWFFFILIYKNKPISINKYFPEEKSLSVNLFYISYLIFFIFTLYSYKALGIPLINELNDKPRLDTYTGSGLGYISRVMPIFYNYCIFYLIFKLDSQNGKLNIFKNLLLLLPFIITGILSGSRSSFLGIVFIFWAYKFLFINSEPKLMNYKWLLIPFLFISLFVFSFQSNTNIFYSSYLFLERVISSGDLYWDSLPDDNWKNVIINYPIKHTFMGLLGPIRLLNVSNAETPIGYQLTELVFPNYLDKSTGPVALYPIYGLVCFGYIGGLIFSIIQGIIAGILLKITLIKSKSIIICSVSFYLFNSFLFFLGDMSAALGMLLNGTISVIIFFMILAILIGFNKKNTQP